MKILFNFEMFVWFHHPVQSHESAELHTHHNQGHFALPVGPVGSQDGDHHGDGAHHVEDDEAGGPTLQLEEAEGQVNVCFYDYSVCKFYVCVVCLFLLLLFHERL